MVSFEILLHKLDINMLLVVMEFFDIRKFHLQKGADSVGKGNQGTNFNNRRSDCRAVFISSC